jgi:hypothetical protein
MALERLVRDNGPFQRFLVAEHELSANAEPTSARHSTTGARQEVLLLPDADALLKIAEYAERLAHTLRGCCPPARWVLAPYSAPRWWPRSSGPADIQAALSALRDLISGLRLDLASAAPDDQPYQSSSALTSAKPRPDASVRWWPPKVMYALESLQTSCRHVNAHVDEYANGDSGDATLEELVSIEAAALVIRTGVEETLPAGNRQEAQAGVEEKPQATDADRIESPPATEQELAGHAGRRIRPAYKRDHCWLKWADEGLTPAKIRDRWNALSDEGRKGICGEAWGRIGGSSPAQKKAGYEVVKGGLKKAKRERAAEKNRGS